MFLFKLICFSSEFLTNVVPFKRGINMFADDIRFTAKNHFYNKETNDQTQISRVFELSLCEKPVMDYRLI